MTVVPFDSYARRIAAEGLTVRGAFHVEEADAVPDLGGGAGERTLILIGNAGSSFWPAFALSPEYRDGEPDPLDRWSERVITQLAHAIDACPLFPFGGPPYHPFQRWARRAESVYPSPLGTLVHPEYGPWHAYRGALVVDGRLEGLPAGSGAPSPCLSCAAQPCLHACPVGAFSGEGFDVGACSGHLSGPSECRDRGCLARNACPAGKPFRYVREQHRFHLAAFLRARQVGGE
jgi:hypothetical protein